MSENEGLTNEIENSSELEEAEVDTSEIVDSDVEEEPKVEEKPTTKKVSDRINQIRAEAEARLQEESAKYQKQIEDYQKRLYKYEAEEKGITVEELIAEKDAETKRNNDIVENDPRYQALLQRDFERQKLETLKTIQDAYPEENLKDIESLPDDFYKMLQAGVDPAKAYRASVIMDRKDTPPSSGSVKTNEVEKQATYTREQVASMSQEEVHEHWDDITKSMKNW